MKNDWTCDECGNTEMEELWMFGSFNNNKDDKEYCSDCWENIGESCEHDV